MKYHLVNTDNKFAEERLEDEMLVSESAIAALSSKEQIDQIDGCDVVFLYKNKVGIIAYGTATGERKTEPFRYDPTGKYIMPLNPFRVLESPIPFSQIEELQRELAGKGVFTAKAVQGLDERTGAALYEIAGET